MMDSRYKKLPVWFALVVCLLASTGVNGSQRLRIGDVVPNVHLPRLINHPNKEATLNEFRSKLLIIDFWDVYCASCIRNMPKMEALKRTYGDRIQILLVTRSSEEQVRNLRNRNTIVRDCTLPMVIADSTLSPLFAYQTVPTYAWIDQQGVLKHFTGTSHFLTETYIDQFLAGQPLKMPLKEEYGDFRPAESLLTEGGGRNLDRLDYYSLISRWVNFGGQSRLPLRDPETGQIIGKHLINLSRVDLFLSAYADSLKTNGFRLLDNRVIVELPDSIDYQSYDLHYLDDNWKQRNVFCYESRMPPDRSHLLNEVMKRDLTLYFGVKARIENREMDCLVLKDLNPLNPTEKLKTAGGKPEAKLPAKDNALKLVNSNFSSLLLGIGMMFASNEQQPILLNESTINRSTRIDIHIASDLGNLNAVRSQLQAYGLDLEPQRKNIPMLVLSQ
ncbi:TlpA family protein disulfide reductase [Parapedobacter sp. GCM10030251]|uniref:TlpA family protein disulfide reductase n=1 Tax=Parapedobacter sp. GCM10030251 TaxID=3273419 RepID=UPI003619E754